MYQLFVWVCIIAIGVVLQTVIHPGFMGAVIWGGLLSIVGLALCEAHEESK